MLNLNVGTRYNFDVYAPGIMGEFKNVTVLGKIDASMANRDTDIHALHVQVFPYLPAGTPNDPTKYDYFIVRNESGSRTVLGEAHIRPETVDEVNSKRINVLVGGSVTTADVPRVRAALVSNGFTDLEITVVD
jgi:hypothetical protein